MRSVKFFVSSNLELKFTSVTVIAVALCGFGAISDEPKSRAVMPSENMRIINGISNKSKNQVSGNDVPSREFVTNAGVDLAKLYGAVMSNDLVLDKESCNQPSLGAVVDAIELEKNFQGPKIYTIGNEKYKAKKIPNRGILAMTSSSGVIESNWLNVEKNEKKNIVAQTNDKSETAIAKIENDEVKDAISALSDLSARRRNATLKDGPTIKRSLATDPIPDESSYASSKRIMDLANSGLMITPPSSDGKGPSETPNLAKNQEPSKTQGSQTTDSLPKTALPVQSSENSTNKTAKEPLNINSSKDVSAVSSNLQTVSHEKTTQSPAVNMVVQGDVNKYINISNSELIKVKDTYHVNSNGSSQTANFEENNEMALTAKNHHYENKPGLDLLYPSGKLTNRSPSNKNIGNLYNTTINKKDVAEKVKLNEAKTVEENIVNSNSTAGFSSDKNPTHQKLIPDVKQYNKSNAIEFLKIVQKQLQDQKEKPIVEKEKFGY